MSGQRGDYLGFTFNGVHSSDLGIVRTSDGSRFNENLLPTIQDKTVQIPGRDGSHFFGSYYTSKQFNISFAYDSMTESQMNRLKQVLGDKKIHDLVFDEAPYKIYSAKITGSATIKYIPFAEGETNRVYKGEGTIQFTAYNPYARSKFKFGNQYSEANKAEWQDAAGIKQEQDDIDKLVGNKIKVYNPGSKESDFSLRINFINGMIPKGGLVLTNEHSGKTISSLYFKGMSAKTARGATAPDSYVKIDTKLNLIEGYNSFDEKTGNIYNSTVTSGFFFNIPQVLDDNTNLIIVTYDNQETNLTDDGYLIEEPLEYCYYYL